jgi:hypothetical protein
MISLHVDDFTISSDLQTTLDGIGKALAGKFEMTDDGELSHVLGLKIERDMDRNLLYISQQAYSREILFSMEDARDVKTPMEDLTVSASDCPLPGSEEQLEMIKVPYREACGALMSLAINSRPDILFAVGVLAATCIIPYHTTAEALWLRETLISMGLCSSGSSIS